MSRDQICCIKCTEIRQGPVQVLVVDSRCNAQRELDNFLLPLIGCTWVSGCKRHGYSSVWREAGVSATVGNPEPGRGREAAAKRWHVSRRPRKSGRKAGDVRDGPSNTRSDRQGLGRE